MTDKSLWRGVLMVALSVVLAQPAEARAGGGKIVSTGTIVGAIVGIVAAVVVVTVVVIHESSKEENDYGSCQLGRERDKREGRKGQADTCCRATRQAFGRVIESPCQERR